MNGGWGVLAEPWLVGLGWFALLSVWLTTLAALSLAIWQLLHPSAAAAARYRASMASLVGGAVLSAVALPLALATLSGDGRPETPSASPGAVGQVADSAGAQQPPIQTGGGVTASLLERIGSATLPPTALGAAGVLWLLGTALMLARLVTACFAVGRLRRRATSIDAGDLHRTFEALSGAAGVAGTGLARSTDIEAPVAVGIRVPAVLVPTHLLEYATSEELAPVLVHELAHVARRDYAANIVQSTLEATLFHSPAIWWMSARVRETREFCCDDASVTWGNRTRYIETLTLVARHGASTEGRPAVGIAGPRLITRIRRLLEGESTVSMPFARMSLVVASAAVTVATLPPLFALATSQLSAPLLAAEQSGQEQPGIPFSFPSRQNGSGLEILDIATSDGHVCGSFDVQNVSTTPIERVRFIGVIEYRAPSTRPVQIVESDWIAGPLAPGTRSRLRADLFDAAVARQANGDERVQAFCAVREVTFTNGARWGVLPNARAIRARDVLNDDRPTLPRALVGQTHVLSASKQMLCLDEKGAEYSAGAQVAIREAPDRAARCSATGHWTEVNAATGEPLTAATSAANVVTLELTVEGVTPPLQLKSTTGSVATVQVPGGRTWGVVPSAGADGGVAVALHDMSARPDRLIGTRTLRPGESTRFPDLSPALSIRLVPE